MPNPDDVIQERRVGSRRMVNELVGVRDEMLSLYSDLASQHPFEDNDSVGELLEQFCQALIDYTASAHFRLYRYLDEQRERRRAVLEIADQAYPTIVSTTDSILEFNDKYETAESDTSCPIESLEHDLSMLGERLADRIEVEDRLIEALSAGGR